MYISFVLKWDQIGHLSPYYLFFAFTTGLYFMLWNKMTAMNRSILLNKNLIQSFLRIKFTNFSERERERERERENWASLNEGVPNYFIQKNHAIWYFPDLTLNFNKFELYAKFSWDCLIGSGEDFKIFFHLFLLSGFIISAPWKRTWPLIWT